MALTEKQKRFVQEYLIDLNATKAASRAGYKNAEIGRQLIAKNNVAEALQEAMQKRSKRTEVTQDMVIKELEKIGFKDAADYPLADLKYSNKIRALELLGKHMGMFVDRVMVSEVDPEVITEVEKLVLGDDQG